MSEAAKQFLHPKLRDNLDRQAQQNLVVLFNLDSNKAKSLVFLVQKCPEARINEMSRFEFKVNLSGHLSVYPQEKG